MRKEDKFMIIIFISTIACFYLYDYIHKNCHKITYNYRICPKVLDAPTDKYYIKEMNND